MNRLDTTREKLKRADKHIEDFKSGCNDFLRKNPQHVWYDPNELTVQKTLSIRIEEFPASLVCMVGDAVHNLRSALDHLAYAVAEANHAPASILTGINFTIRDNSHSFNKAIKDEKAKISLAWTSFLKKVEPYYGGQGSDLYVISTLDNFDKHRNLLIVDARCDTFTYDPINNAYTPIERGLSFKDGISIALDPSDPKYHTHSQTRIVIGEKIPGLDPNAWASVVLERLAKSTGDVINRAQAEVSLFP